jgi:peptidoglycan hydrolase-like protein with peptidoglycan-binding domain
MRRKLWQALSPRKLWIAGAAVAVLGTAVAVAVMSRDSGPDETRARLPPATARVVKTTLVEAKTVAGTLGYGDPVPVQAAGTGTITWIAPAGSTVERGSPLFAIDTRPVVALYGTLPLYRPLVVGRAGADVRELEENLAALGYAGLEVDDTFTSGTAAAVRRWQTDLGLPASGVVEPGQVVVNAGPVRVGENTARVGDTIGGGASGGEAGGTREGEAAGSRGGAAAVLSYTSTSRLVTLDLAVADRPLAVPGRTVKVTVPGAGTVDGTIASVGNAATAKAPTSAADARISVTVTIADQAALGSLDTAPVDVDLVSDERKDVLAVPVAALLALPDGGFGVEVVEGPTTRIVSVQTGLFAGGRVEISGNGIAEGTTVGVAK